MIKVSNKNKIIVSIIIMLIMLIIMSVSSLAWFGYPNTPISYKYDDTFIYQVIYFGNGLTRLGVSDTPFYRIFNSWGNEGINSSSVIYLFDYVSGNWEYLGYYTNGIWPKSIYQSTHDIYTDSSLTDVFFSVPRQTPMQKTLTQHPPLTLMKSRLAGLIPLLIGLLIVSVGFYKGLSVLFKTLQQA